MNKTVEFPHLIVNCVEVAKETESEHDTNHKSYCIARKCMISRMLVARGYQADHKIQTRFEIDFSPYLRSNKNVFAHTHL